jgi:hypothetical protein
MNGEYMIKNLKSLDIVILCKLFILCNKKRMNWTYSTLSNEVCLSVGETHASVKRLINARLYDALSKSVVPSSMADFLSYGVPYAFPANIGPVERGLATAHSAPVFKNAIIHSENDVYVWPYALGNERGLSISPLSKNVPEAVLKDSELYGLLALIDAVRIGRAREKSFALEQIKLQIHDVPVNADFSNKYRSN